MTQPNEQDPTQKSDAATFTGITILGEAHRSPELREARDAFTDRTNEFLESLAFERERDGNVTKGGFVLGHSDIITETDLGTNSQGLKSVGINYKPGITLKGDGKETPLELQAVLPSAWVEGNDGHKAITMRGTDPLDRQMYGDHQYDMSRNLETIASFKVEEDQGGVQSASGYNVTGDGDFRRNFLSDKGVHTSAPVRHLEDASQAQAELEAAITIIQRSLAS
jgi:hypothetical protein